MNSTTSGLVDAHCHIDMYPNPLRAAREADRLGISTIAVTNLPSHYVLARANLTGCRRVHAALGLHPLQVKRHDAELESFCRLAKDAQFIGEVGLDFSSASKGTKDEQIHSFRAVLQAIQRPWRFVTVHSRGAEETVLDLLDEYGVGPVVMHWYCGSLETLARAAEAGHYFSVNPAMVRSRKGSTLVPSMPPERVLTESDGPYCQVGRKPAKPEHVSLVLRALSDLWRVSVLDATSQVSSNAASLMAHNRSRD